MGWLGLAGWGWLGLAYRGLTWVVPHNNNKAVVQISVMSGSIQ